MIFLVLDAAQVSHGLRVPTAERSVFLYDYQRHWASLNHVNIRTECQRCTGLCVPFISPTFCMPPYIRCIGGSGWVDRNRLCLHLRRLSSFRRRTFLRSPATPPMFCIMIDLFSKITSCSFLHPVFSIFYKYPII